MNIYVQSEMDKATQNVFILIISLLIKHMLQTLHIWKIKYLIVSEYQKRRIEELTTTVLVPVIFRIELFVLISVADEAQKISREID